MKQTAVEWLQQQYNQCPKYEEQIYEQDWEQAKEMEKQQQGYSREEVLELIKQRDLHNIIHLGGNRTHINREEWFEQNKKK